MKLSSFEVLIWNVTVPILTNLNPFIPQKLPEQIIFADY